VDIANKYLRRAVILHLHKFRRNYDLAVIFLLLFAVRVPSFRTARTPKAPRVETRSFVMHYYATVFVWHRYPVNIQYIFGLLKYSVARIRVYAKAQIMTIFINVVGICLLYECTFYAKNYCIIILYNIINAFFRQYKTNV